jgi:hypothetical protein
MPPEIPANPKMFCGRIHFGPICVNGGPRGEPICEWCKCRVDRADRDQVQKQWNTLTHYLRPIKEAMAKEKKR